MLKVEGNNNIHLLFAFFLLTSYFLSVFWRLLFLVCGLVLGLAEVAWCEGQYQSTRDGKTLVWNSAPKPGDIATWSGDRDRGDYAHGFGRLVWYTLDPDSSEPELYARYWGRMVDGKFEGPVNVHAKGKTHHAIFIDGTRVTRWVPGTAPTRANAQWRRLVENHNQKIEFASNAELRPAEASSADDAARRTFALPINRRAEPEAPAAGPADDTSARSQRSDVSGQSSEMESIQDLYNERWPKIDMDDSIRLLAFPPRRLR